MLVIVVVVWRLHRFPEEFNTTRIPYKMMKNRMHYKAGILALLYIYPVFPLITSSMFWPAGVVIAFFVTMFVLPNIVWFGKLFTDDYEKDWNNRRS